MNQQQAEHLAQRIHAELTEAEIGHSLHVEGGNVGGDTYSVLIQSHLGPYTIHGYRQWNSEHREFVTDAMYAAQCSGPASVCVVMRHEVL